MLARLNHTLDQVSNFLAPRKGLLPMVGIFLIMVNYLLQWVAPGWVSSTDLFLHLGMIISILGIMLAWAL